MALYKLHKVKWEQELRQSTEAWKAKTGRGKVEGNEPQQSNGKRKREIQEEEEEDVEQMVDGKKPKRKEGFPGGGRKGISSGLNVVVRRNGQANDANGARKWARGGGDDVFGGKWWEEAAQ